MPLVKWIKQKRRNSVAANAAAENDRSDGRVSERRRRRSHQDAEGGLRPASSPVSEVSEVAVAPTPVDRQRSRSFDPAAVDPSVGSEAAAAALKIMVAHLCRSLPPPLALFYSVMPLPAYCRWSRQALRLSEKCGSLAALSLGSLRNDT